MGFNIGKALGGVVSHLGVSTIAGMVGTAVGGPIGGVIGKAVGNLVGDAVGGAANQAISTLSKEFGMPKFLAGALTAAVDKAVAGLKDANVPADAMKSAQEQFGKSIEDLVSGLAKQIVDKVMAERKEGSGAEGASGKGGSESWMVAIAKAMGKMMGDRASKLVSLSNEMTKTTANAGDTNGQMAAASKMQELNAQFQGVNQEFTLLQNTFSTAIKSIGEAMSAVARKQ